MAADKVYKRHHTVRLLQGFRPVKLRGFIAFTARACKLMRFLQVSLLILFSPLCLDFLDDIIMTDTNTNTLDRSSVIRGPNTASQHTGTCFLLHLKSKIIGRKQWCN